MINEDFFYARIPRVDKRWSKCISVAGDRVVK